MMFIVGAQYAVAQEYQDVVYLKNGTVIKGFYHDFYTADSLRMETIDGGYFVCNINDIYRIAKERKDVYLLKKRDTEREWRLKGYRAFIDYGSWVNIKDTRVLATAFSTTHGYQFNRHLFLGAGIGIENISVADREYTILQNGINLPAFVAAKAYILRTRIAPYIDLRGGYTVLGIKGWNAAAAAGVDFCITPRLGLYANVGYSLMQLKDPEYRDSENNEFLHNAFLKLGIHF